MPFQNLDLFVIAAEPSADRHGIEIVGELLSVNPHLKVAGVLGPNLRSLNIACFFPMEKLQVMGFTDVLLSLPKIIYRFFLLKKFLLKANPKAVLFIDYPEFNLRLERSLKKNNFKGRIFHHISPTVWAWAKKRISIMEKGIDELFCIFPFEKKIFEKASFNTSYVGHPLLEAIQKYSYKSNFYKKYNIGPQENLLAIFPGSRLKEIKRNLKIQLSVADKLKSENKGLKIALSISNSSVEKNIKKILKKTAIKVICVSASDSYNLMKACNMAIATSGTVTLELAFHEVPTVVTFGIQLLDLIIIQKVLKIDLPFFCIVNIITKEPILPELFGPNLSFNKLFYWANKVLNDQTFRENIINACKGLKNSFENKSPKKKISKKILAFLNKEF